MLVVKMQGACSMAFVFKKKKKFLLEARLSERFATLKVGQEKREISG